MIIAIDPGEKHCGVAWFTNTGSARDTMTMTPTELFDFLEAYPKAGEDTLVIEIYRVYPWMIDVHGWSEVETAQVIGVIKYIALRKGVEFFEQGANIKKPTFGILRGKNISLCGKDQHQRDAEAHGWHHILNTKGGASE